MKKIAVFVLMAICAVCLAFGISACGSVETKTWHRSALICTEDTYDKYSSDLSQNCFENTTGNEDAVLLFENESLSKLEMDTDYYFIAGINAATQDGTAVTNFHAEFSFKLRNIYTSELLSKDCMTIVSSTVYTGGNSNKVYFTWSESSGYSYEVDSSSFSSDSEVWYCIVVCFRMSEECKLTATAYSKGSYHSSNSTDYSTITRTATAYYDNKVNISSLSVKYLSSDAFNNGDFSGSDLTSSPTLNIGSSVYIVIDLEMQSAYDADKDKVTVRVEVSPSDSMVARITDADTSTISNETIEDNVSIASATYSLPEKSGDTRSERLIVQLTAYLTGSAKIALHFYADGVSFTGSNTYSKSVTIADAVSETDSGSSGDGSSSASADGIQYRLSSDKSYYTIASISTGLTAVEIPDTYGDLPVTGIEDGALSGGAVQTLTIGENVTSIGNGAFSGCSALYSLTLGSSVTDIGSSAFEDCYRLVEIYNKSGIALSAGTAAYGSVAYYALNIYTPSSGQSRLVNSNGRIYAYDSSDTCYLVSFISTETSPVITGTVSDDTVNDLVIRKYAFYGTSCTSVTLASSVVKVEGYAFYGSSIKEITIGSGLKSIESYAFSCDTLTSVTVPDTVTAIGGGAFSGCSALTTITLPFVGADAAATTPSATTLFGYIFGTTNYEGSILTKQIYKEGSAMSYYIPVSLETVTITGGSVLYGAFENCCYLTSITLPDDLTSVGTYAFLGCSSLKNITLPECITVIEKGLFYECLSLASITIPSGVTSIGVFVFYRCTSLTSITIPGGVTSIGESAFSKCSSLTSITIPSGVTSIDGYTFYECSSLKSVTIGGNVTSIGSGAFGECTSLESITIPGSVTEINNLAFVECSSLKSVTFENRGGWYVYTYASSTSGKSVNLATDKTNATYLTDTYASYYWRRG